MNDKYCQLDPTYCAFAPRANPLISPGLTFPYRLPHPLIDVIVIIFVGNRGWYKEERRCLPTLSIDSLISCGMVRVKEAHLTTPCMPTCSDQPSTSFHVQVSASPLSISNKCLVRWPNWLQTLTKWKPSSFSGEWNKKEASISKKENDENIISDSFENSCKRTQTSYMFYLIE